MKTAITAIFAFALIYATSCKKNDSAPTNTGNSNTWSFAGSSYTVTTCTTAAGELIASDGSISTLTLVFNDATVPGTNGTYSVGGSGIGGTVTQVGAQLSVGNNSYISTGGSGNQVVTVNVSAGKVTAQGKGITMESIANANDTASVNFNVTQQ